MKMLSSLIVTAFALTLVVSSVLAQSDAGALPDRGTIVFNCGTIPDQEPTNNSIASPTVLDIACRSTAVGILELTAGDSDYFIVPGQVGDFYSVFTVPLSTLPLGFNQADTVVEVYGPANEFLVSSDDAGHTFPAGVFRRSSAVRFAPQATGSFKIHVRGFNSSVSGRYGLIIANVSTAQYTEATGGTFADSIHVPSDLAGPLVGYAITAETDVDYYSVDLNPGDVLLAATSSTDSTTDLNSTNMDIRLFAPDQATQIVVSFSDAGANYPPGGNFNTSSLNGFVLARASVTGRHYIEVKPTAGNTGGEYHLLTWIIPARFCPGDADGSGNVQFLDITTVLANFGNSCP